MDERERSLAIMLGVEFCEHVGSFRDFRDLDGEPHAVRSTIERGDGTFSIAFADNLVAHVTVVVERGE